MLATRPTVAARWRDHLQAMDHLDLWLSRWHKDGTLQPQQAAALAQLVATRRQDWQKMDAADKPPPADSGLPEMVEGESTAASTLRHWKFVERQVDRPDFSSLLSLAQRHAVQAEIAEHEARWSLQLGPEDVAVVEPDAELPTAPLDDEAPLTVFPAPARVLREEAARRAARAPRRSVLEIVLDPRNSQWLLAFGGALMVVGLVILLYVNDLIAAPAVAVGLGVVNLGLLLGGWWVLRKTRHAIAGQGLTLLACLVMPLNLWYYHANHLVTVDGHLWVAAVVVSTLYIASAWVLRSELFVFVFVGGLTLTGMLFLADIPPSPQHLQEIAAPATLLVVLGLACIHAERAFPEQPGPFSRRRFGLAFFWSGHALLASGLLLVLVAQFCGHWLYDAGFKEVYRVLQLQPSPIVGELRWLAILLVAAGTYAYLYSDLVVRKLGVYVYIAAFTLMWLLVLCLEYFHFGLGLSLGILVLSATAAVFNGLHATLLKDKPAARTLPYLGVLLPLLAMMLALVVYLNAISPDLKSVWKLEPPTWAFVAAMAATAASARYGAYLYRHTHRELSVLYFFATAGATMIGAAALAAAIGLPEWQQHACLLALVPVAYLVAARLYRGHSPAEPLQWVANAALGVMLFSSFSTAFDGFTHFIQGEAINLVLALFFLEAALFFGLAAALLRQPAAIHFATAMLCAVVWQLLTYLGVPGEYYALAFAVLGVALLVSYRFALLEGYTGGRLALEAFQGANTLLLVAFAVTFLLGVPRLASREHHWAYVGLCIGMVAVGAGAVALVREVHWRRAYVVLTVLQMGLTFLALTVFSDLTAWQKLEIVSVAMGLALLAAGHVGWYREGERHSDLVTLALLFGSVLVGLPLVVATLVDRLRDQFYVLNEVGFLAAGVLLLASGIVCQLRSTTLTGAVLTALYFLTLLIFIPWSRLNALAWFILIGGGVVFALGLALSVFRERLLHMPERVRSRQGLFRVLKWR
jgi:hypothetical protein